MASEPARTYPSELPVLALRQTVVFPLTLQPLAINRPLSVESINRALAGDRLVFLALQSTDTEEPEPAGRSARSGRWRRSRTAPSTSSSKGCSARRATSRPRAACRCARSCRPCRM